MAGRRDQAEPAFQRALELLEGSAGRDRAGLAAARSGIPRSDLHAAGGAGERSQGDRAARARGGAGAEERSEALAALAWAQAVSGSVEEAERLLAQLGADARRATTYAPTTSATRERWHRCVAAGSSSLTDRRSPPVTRLSRAGRPDLAYGCWANAAGAAAAAGEHRRALEFLDRGVSAIDGHGLQSLEIHLLAARSFVLSRLGRLDDARRAAESEQILAERLGAPGLVAMAAHDRGLVALEGGEFELAAVLLEESLVEGAPISRPLTRLALAEALAAKRDADKAADQIRATVLEPVRPSDFPEALVPRLARVQALVALARELTTRHSSGSTNRSPGGKTCSAGPARRDDHNCARRPRSSGGRADRA